VAAGLDASLLFASSSSFLTFSSKNSFSAFSFA
jgi:hypothetical protein